MHAHRYELDSLWEYGIPEVIPYCATFLEAENQCEFSVLRELGYASFLKIVIQLYLYMLRLVCSDSHLRHLL